MRFFKRIHHKLKNHPSNDDQKWRIFDIWKAELEDVWSRTTEQEQNEWSRKHALTNRRKAHVSNELKREILERDLRTCRYCGKPMSKSTEWEFDHVHPFSKGGETTLENLVVACKECNQVKKHLHGIKPIPLAEIKRLSDANDLALGKSKKRRENQFKKWKSLLKTRNQNDIDRHHFFYRYDHYQSTKIQTLTSDDSASKDEAKPSDLDKVYDIDSWIREYFQQQITS